MLTASSPASVDYRRDLGNGLVLRWSTSDDTERIVQLVSIVFREKEDDPPNEHLTNFVRRLMRGDHPLMGSGDYGIVEDTSREGNPVVACTCLWRHTWYYEDIPFPMGRPEIVATHSDYRNRGLIRALFEMVHGRSEAEGHMAQAITGIPHFYRQFGYEYALDLGGGRGTYLLDVPKAKEDTPEAYTLREATVEDIPQIIAFYRQRRGDSIVWFDADEAFWHYEIEGWKASPQKEKPATVAMIIDTAGTTRGYVYGAGRRWWRNFSIAALDTAPDVNLQALVPPLLRAIQVYGTQLPTAKADTEPFGQISFQLGRSHPIYEILGNKLAPVVEPPYAWYVRVSDVPAFIRHIAPVLERRLAHSIVPGYTGELKIDQYRGGLRLVFDNGKLTGAEHWPVPLYNSNASAGIPQLTFLKLLFGYQSVNELRQAFPDVWVNSEVEAVLNALFPARPSFVMG